MLNVLTESWQGQMYHVFGEDRDKVAVIIVWLKDSDWDLEWLMIGDGTEAEHASQSHENVEDAE